MFWMSTMADKIPQYGSTVGQRWEPLHKVTLWTDDQSATLTRAYYHNDYDADIIKLKLHDEMRTDAGLPADLQGWECLATERRVLARDDDTLDDEEILGQAEVVDSYPRGNHRILEIPDVGPRLPSSPGQLIP